MSKSSYSLTGDMSDRELVQIILGNRIKDDTLSSVTAMMTGEGSADYSILAEEAGVGEATIAKLDAAIELGRRSLTSEAQKKVISISTPEDVEVLMRPLYAGRKKEIFCAILLTTKNKIIKVDQVSTGSLNASIVHPRELFCNAVRHSAASVVITHNHPSGDPTPSGADIQLTKRLIKAGDALGIKVLDHVVIGENEIRSLRDMGLM